MSNTLIWPRAQYVPGCYGQQQRNSISMAVLLAAAAEPFNQYTPTSSRMLPHAPLLRTSLWRLCVEVATTRSSGTRSLPCLAVTTS